MITNYNDYSEFNIWETLHYSINESSDNLLYRMESYIRENILKDGFLERIFKYFKTKTTLLALVIFILITRFDYTPVQVNKSLSSVGIGKTEQDALIHKAKSKLEHGAKSLKDFLIALGNRESGNDPKKINKIGYIGKYQFGHIALKDIKADKKINARSFKKNPNIWPEHQQDRDMKKLLKKNKGYLGEYITKYNGKVIHGINITESGLLASAHLLGASQVKKFLSSNGKIIPKDGFGTPLTEYLKKFGGYKINI